MTSAPDQPESAPPPTPPEPSAASNSLGSRLTAIVIVLFLISISGIAHGMLDGRWNVPADLIDQGALLDQLPEQMGDWVLTEKEELTEGAAKLLRCHGSIVRRYRHTPSGQEVMVSLLFGPRGPIAVHTPDICYSSVGTKAMGSRKTRTLATDSLSHSLWQIQFRSRDSQDAELDVWYGWSDGGTWQASEYPRYWFTNELYKIQIAGPIGTEEFYPCEDFLKLALPEIEDLLR